jgi:hypothetical protein
VNIIWGDSADSLEVPTGHYFAKVMLGDGSIVSGYTLTQSARVVDTAQTYQLIVDGKPETRVLQQLILDNGSNSDNFWYAPDTTLMDSGHADVLKYYGIPMTGGDANGGLAGFAIYNGLFGAAIGMGNLLRYGTGNAQGWEDEIYVDHIQPWLLYGFKADEDDRLSTGVRGTAARNGLDMYITNAFDQIFRGLMAAVGGGEAAPADGINKGWMSARARPSGGWAHGVAHPPRLATTSPRRHRRAVSAFDAWRAAAFILATVGRAANDDENGACIVGNRRVECASESVWGVAA